MRNETMDYVLKISREDASSRQRETIGDDKWMPTRFIVGRLEQSKGADFMVDGLDGRWRENYLVSAVHNYSGILRNAKKLK